MTEHNVSNTHGNTTTLGGQTLGFDPDDRHTTTAVDATTVAYQRDALDRIVARSEDGVVVARHGYTGDVDTPELTLDATNAVAERMVVLPGGVFLTGRAGGDVWSYPNIHGDVVATADAAGAQHGATLVCGWLGTKQRPPNTPEASTPSKWARANTSPPSADSSKPTPSKAAQQTTTTTSTGTPPTGSTSQARTA